MSGKQSEGGIDNKKTWRITIVWDVRNYRIRSDQLHSDEEKWRIGGRRWRSKEIRR